MFNYINLIIKAANISKNVTQENHNKQNDSISDFQVLEELSSVDSISDFQV